MTWLVAGGWWLWQRVMAGGSILYSFLFCRRPIEMKKKTPLQFLLTLVPEEGASGEDGVDGHVVDDGVGPDAVGDERGLDFLRHLHLAAVVRRDLLVLVVVAAGDVDEVDAVRVQHLREPDGAGQRPRVRVLVRGQPVVALTRTSSGIELGIVPRTAATVSSRMRTRLLNMSPYASVRVLLAPDVNECRR